MIVTAKLRTRQFQAELADGRHTFSFNQYYDPAWMDSARCG